MDIVDGQIRYEAADRLGRAVAQLAEQAGILTSGHVGVTARVDDEVEQQLAATSPEAARCDAAQVAHAGPRHAAMAEGRHVTVTSVDDDERWPAWAATCRAAGFGSAAVVTARQDGARVTLSVYRASADEWPRGLLDRLTEIADAIAVVVGASSEVEQVTRLAEDSLAAMRVRAVIDQALGVIMAQNRCGADQAFEILKSASMHRNTKLRVLAAEIVTGVSGQLPRAAEFQPGAPRSSRRPGDALRPSQNAATSSSPTP